MAWTMLAALALAMGGQSMTGVHEQVQVKAQGNQVLVQLTVENEGAQPVYVPRALYGEKMLYSASFDIREEGHGKALGYTGPMVKRGPLSRDDFIRVAPHGRLSNTIDISRSYGYLPGQHTYELRYAGHYIADVEFLNTVTPLALLTATFKR
jgi:hypothetical protein